MTNKSRTIMRILAGIIMGLLGISVALLTINLTNPIGILGQSLGLSLIITGSITVFQESVLSPLKRDELKDHIDRISFQSKENFERIFELLRGPGIYMLSPERRGNLRYYKWLLERSSQQIVFAGHSVLHRVQIDFTNQGLLSIHEALSQKVSEGSKVRILFLDPSWDFLDKIARDEGQEPERLRADLAITLGISKKLWVLLEDKKFAGEIEIRTCTELKQYAFHRVQCKDRDEDEVLVGFYFAGKLGMKSPLFVIENEQIREIFVEHFNTVFERARRLLIYSRDLKSFDHTYYRQCRDDLSRYLDEKSITEHCP